MSWKTEIPQWLRPLLDNGLWIVFWIIGGLWQVGSAKMKGVEISWIFLSMVSSASALLGLLLFNITKAGLMNESWAFILAVFVFAGSRDIMIAYQDNIGKVVGSILGYIPKFIKALFEKKTGAKIENTSTDDHIDEVE